ncbi:hypothetical protein M3194_28415 [Paenibacillus glycanilyticus]|uniref:hypothetical protein n=1 Tax=Paenibacillus glycanilyticus TaxID=126569 RepID=UPI00203D0C55|nr:hypothetical protein [Paenibacillus glycanilyticus]MCM3631231.1 hypothetical protein [Paenibacillus glycanilyticus]
MLNRLSRIDLPQITALVQNNAEDSVLLEALEKLMLEKSESYRLYLEGVHSPNANTLSAVKERFIKDEIHKNPHYRFIYSMLKDPSHSVDCGCGSKKMRSVT